MLKFMREKFQYSLPLKVILIAVAASFVGWGIGTSGRGTKTSDVIAEVLDQKVTLQEFQRYYNNLVESYRRQLGDRFSPELLERMNVKNGAFNALTRQKMQISLALQKGIRVSDDELIREIRATPAFQRDGVFDLQLYQNILRANRLNEHEYEEALREQMLIDKLRFLITDSVKVSDLEVRQAYSRENEKVKVNYLLFDSALYRKRIEPTQEELKKYYEENKESFKKQESLKIKYVKLSPDHYMGEVEVTDEEARSYYDDNLGEFRREERVKARHILIKVPDKPAESDWEKARAEAESLLKKIKEGADFAELAKEFSQDPGSKGKGGELGFFSRGQMVKPFEDAAFALEPGEVSEPVRTKFGYHIIKVEEKQEAGRDSFDSVKGKIVEKLKKTEAGYIAEDRAYNLSYDITAEDFDSIAAREKLTPQISDWVFKGRVIRGIPGSLKISDEAFNLEVGDISKAMEAAGSYYVFTVLEKREPYIPGFEEVEKQVKARYLSKKSRELAEKDADEALAALKAGKTLQDVAGQYELQVKDTGFFSRSGSPKGVGRNPRFVQEAFDLKPGEQGKVDAGSRIYIMVQAGTEGMNEAKFQEEKEEFAKELLENKRELMYRTWLTRSMDRVTINIVGDFTL
jgi:peptidyl-prolyl cis-trans isomerase D